MAERIIKTGIGTYLRPDGIWHFGSQGDKVDVHSDDLERFDRLNVTAASNAEDVREAGVSEARERPAQAAPKADWVDYAESQGMDRSEAEALTKDDLVARFKG